MARPRPNPCQYVLSNARRDDTLEANKSKLMGRSYWFECPKCGYRAQVSGRSDRGFTFCVQTVACRDCRELFDAVTAVRWGAQLKKLSLAQKNGARPANPGVAAHASHCNARSPPGTGFRAGPNRIGVPAAVPIWKKARFRTGSGIDGRRTWPTIQLNRRQQRKQRQEWEFHAVFSEIEAKALPGFSAFSALAADAAV